MKRKPILLSTLAMARRRLNLMNQKNRLSGHLTKYAVSFLTYGSMFKSFMLS